MKLANSQGKLFYGLHFYPGVAEYQQPGQDPYRVFLNEDTLRTMDPSFSGRPVFVMHVDEVTQDVDVLRGEADGWVVRSFYNEADGKHWVEFLVCSERGEEAIKRGMRLSNCYIPKSFASGGLWNGVSYAKEIKDAEYEHLAIVPNPRYEESVILTPEKFKAYNESKIVELKRLANTNEKEENRPMLKLFKRAKVDNSKDFEDMEVVLEKSGKTIGLVKLINDADEAAMKGKSDHLLDVHGSKMTLNELMDKYKACNDELTAMKEKAKNDEAAKEHDKGDEGHLENDEDEEAKKKALQLAEHEDKEIEEAKKKNDEEEAMKKKNAADAAAAKKVADKKKADALRNAHTKQHAPAVVEIGADKIERGKARYGSN